ncbi:MAG: hypothetical protein AB7E29_12770 [Xanthobacter sp.]
MSEERDPSLDTLLDLDGQVLVVDPEGGHWVKFVVTRVPASPEKPHGLDYSLTLHGPSGLRANGWSASIMPIRSAEAGGASRWTIGTASRP